MKLFLIGFAVIAAVAADVSHLSSEYLPPALEEAQTVVEAPVDASGSYDQGSLADDGYRYKTNKRVVLRRHRRDVNELSNEYLPPSAAPSTEYLAPVPAPSNEYLAPVAPVEQGRLADDGYRYKTHRRVVLRRHRRDVSHLPSNEYLPPQQVAAAPSNEYLPPQQVAAPVQVAAPAPIEAVQTIEELLPAHELADDGYRYKTHRRVVLRRHRRDVSHVIANEYLPPQADAPSNEYLPPQQVAAPIQVAAPAPVYVSAPAPAPAPIQVAAPAPIQVSAPVVEAEPAHELAADGYRYKTHRRVVYRRH